MDASGKALSEIVESVKKVNDIVAEIAAASQEQSSGIEQVNKAVMQMDETTQQNAALVEEAAAASKSMEEQAHNLTQVVAFFKTGAGMASAPGAMAPKPAYAVPAKGNGQAAPERKATMRVVSPAKVWPACEGGPGRRRARPGQEGRRRRGRVGRILENARNVEP